MEETAWDQVAYNAYGESCSWKNWQGLAMPTWDELPAVTRGHWLAVTVALHEAFGL